MCQMSVKKYKMLNARRLHTKHGLQVLSRVAAATLEPDDLPFEHIVLEECIRETHEKYSRRVFYVRPLVQRLLRRLSHSDAEDLAQSLYQLYPLKSTLSHFVTMNRSLLSAVTAVMQDDRDMVDACLTARQRVANGGSQAADAAAGGDILLSQPDCTPSQAVEQADLDRLELLLEVYHSRITESLQASEELLRNVDGKRELMQLQMSAYRNYLIHKELQLSIAGVTVAIPTFIVGAFGMNLTSGLEETMNVFWPMTALSLVAGGLAYRLMANAITASSPTVRQYQRLQEFIIGIDGQVQSAATALRQLHTTNLGGGSSDGQDTGSAVLGEGMRLKPEQFKELYAVVNGRQPSDSEVALLYDMFDADADGALELDEALSLLQDGQVPTSDR